MTYPHSRFAADLIGDLSFRARYGGQCGALQLIPLDALAAITLSLDADDERVRDELVSTWIPRAYYVPIIEVEIAVDSTSPTLLGTPLARLLRGPLPPTEGFARHAPILIGPIRSAAILAAHRILGSTHVRGRISWPARIPMQWRRRLARVRGTFVEAS
jgi:hypothetical protein